MEITQTCADSQNMTTPPREAPNPTFIWTWMSQYTNSKPPEWVAWVQAGHTPTGTLTIFYTPTQTVVFNAEVPLIPELEPDLVIKNEWERLVCNWIEHNPHY